MKTLIFSLLFLYSFHSKAEKCPVEFDHDYVEVHWEAFKTPKKIGVKGRFKELGLTKKKFKGDSFKSILEGQSFRINSASLRSRKPVRDANITKYFFLKMTGGLFLTGQITKVDTANKKLHFELSMNSVTRKVILDIKKTPTKWHATGSIDVLNFGMYNALSSLNKACFKKHQGKTWSDVKIDLIIWYEKECD